MNITDNVCENGTARRDVKTLLLCKVAPSTEEGHAYAYSKIYCPKGRNGHRYITLGGFDAVTLYSTPKKDETKWLEGVLEDKQNIIKEIDDRISYHPIHIVRNNGDEFPSNQLLLTHPFLLIIFVYGLGDNSKEKTLRKSLGAESTRIYHCINISDRVILHYTNNIPSSLQKIGELEENGIVRKSYTTISFPLANNGEVDLTAIQTLQNQNWEKLSVCIQGSFRDYAAWKDYLKVEPPLPDMDTLGIPSFLSNCSCFYTYGEGDFTFTGDVDSKQLAALLKYFIKNSKRISKACWDIHTELQLPSDEMQSAEKKVAEKYWMDNPPKDNHPLENKKIEQRPLIEIEDILKTQYMRFRDNLNNIDKQYTLENDFSWRFPLKELFSAQLNIDQHPIFHGPSYILYDVFRIFNDYLSAMWNYSSGTIPDVNEDRIDACIQRSRKIIDKFIRSLAQLTDQLTRNDDVVFRGMGRVPSIASTLPENLLEFYHSFLCLLADFLIDVDLEKGAKMKPEYGFLLAPELNQRMSLTPLFKLSLSDRKDENGNYFWPQKQAYIIELPTDDIFNPMQCFLPLAHECFHIFGDKLRFRRQRFNYMVLFVASTLAVAFDLDNRDNNELCMQFAIQLFPQDNGGQEDYYYSDNAVEVLAKQAEKLISEAGFAEIRSRLDTYSKEKILYSRVTLSKLQNAEDHFSDEGNLHPTMITTGRIIEVCNYFFKECYADIMAITVFGITAAEYIEAFKPEFRAFILDAKTSMGNRPECSSKYQDDDKYYLQSELMILCQRISIVLAAQARTDAKSCESYLKTIQDSIEQVRKDSPYNDCSVAPDGQKICDILLTCVQSLINKGATPLQPKDNDNHSILGVFPVQALNFVVEYLARVVKYYNGLESRDVDHTIEKEKSLQDRKKYLEKSFDKLIRKEDFFSPTFFEVIENNRGRLIKQINDLKRESAKD